MEERIILAIQYQGRLGSLVPDFLRKGGFQADFQERELRVVCSNFPLELIRVRHKEIIDIVATGNADLGIVGSDLFEEKTLKKFIRGNDFQVEELLKLGFGKCSIVVAVPKDSSYRTIQDLKDKRIATKFEHIASSYFYNKGINVEIIGSEGSIEIAPFIGRSDAIVDLMSSGTSLDQNNLMAIDTIYEAEAILIGNRERCYQKNALIQDFKDRLASVVKANDANKAKYVICKTPPEKRGEVQELLSDFDLLFSAVGQKDCATGGFFYLQAIVPEDAVWDVYEGLKSKGIPEIAILSLEFLFQR